MFHRAGHAEARGEHRAFLLGQKLADDRVQARVGGAGKALVPFQAERTADGLEDGEIGFGSADIAGEDYIITIGHGETGG